MKVLFLDVDGVLNSRTHPAFGFHKEAPGLMGMAPEHGAILQEVLNSTGAKIVISSTWRKYWSLQVIKKMLKEYRCRCRYYRYYSFS